MSAIVGLEGRGGSMMDANLASIGGAD